MAQKLSEITYGIKRGIDGKDYYYANVDNPYFKYMLWETEEICRLATALFVTSNCTIQEFEQMIGSTFRMWGIKSEWSILTSKMDI